MNRLGRVLGCVVAGCVVMMSSGCVSRLGDFSVLATGAPQYEKMGSAPMQSGVEGTSSRVWLGPLPLGGAPNVKEAVDKCLDAGGGDFMERARIYSTDWTLIVLSYGSYTVHGEVGNSKFDQMRAK